MHTKTLIGLITAVGILALGGWVYFFTKPEAQPAKPSIVATIYPIYDLTRQIAGEDLVVELIVPPGVDPKTYTPTESDQEKMKSAEVVFVVGQGFDSWVESTQKLSLEKNVTLEEPYYWLSLSNAKTIIQTITTELSARHPQLAPRFSDRAGLYIQQLNQLHEKYKTATQSATLLDPYGGSIDKDTYLNLMEYNLNQQTEN